MGAALRCTFKKPTKVAYSFASSITKKTLFNMNRVVDRGKKLACVVFVCACMLSSMLSSVLPRFDKSIGETVLCDASMEYVAGFFEVYKGDRFVGLSLKELTPFSL